MSADVITRTADASRGQARRGYPNRRARGGNNPQHPPPTHRGPNNRNNRAKEKNVDTTISNNQEPAEQESTTTAPQSEETTGANSDNIIAAPKPEAAADVCWICAEPVKYYSLSECNHRTCHVCAIRLRALYKKTDCTFCKVSFQWGKGVFDCDLPLPLADLYVSLGSTDCGYFHRFA